MRQLGQRGKGAKGDFKFQFSAVCVPRPLSLQNQSHSCFYYSQFFIIVTIRAKVHLILTLSSITGLCCRQGSKTQANKSPTDGYRHCMTGCCLSPEEDGIWPHPLRLPWVMSCLELGSVSHLSPITVNHGALIKNCHCKSLRDHTLQVKKKKIPQPCKPLTATRTRTGTKLSHLPTPSVATSCS